jgi:hypothetical protein
MMSQHAAGLLEILVGEEPLFWTGIGYTAESLAFAEFLLGLAVSRYRQQVERSKKIVESSWAQIVIHQEGMHRLSIKTNILIFA